MNTTTEPGFDWSLARSFLAVLDQGGVERGRAYADLARRSPGFRLRLPLSDARAWDLTDKIP